MASLLLIGISLSMDAFSLSLAYGITNIKQNNKLFLSTIVAIYHFIMPLIGFFFSSIIVRISIINIYIVASLILIYVGIDLIISKEEKLLKDNIISYLLFGLSVSIDSLTVGIGLKAITDSFILSSLIFSLTSFFFTIIGLNIGNYIGTHLNKYSKYLGGIILIIIGIFIYNRR